MDCRGRAGHRWKGQRESPREHPSLDCVESLPERETVATAFYREGSTAHTRFPPCRWTRPWVCHGHNFGISRYGGTTQHDVRYRTGQGLKTSKHWGGRGWSSANPFCLCLLSLEQPSDAVRCHDERKACESLRSCIWGPRQSLGDQVQPLPICLE